MQFESIDAVIVACSVHGDTLGRDISNYTDAQPVIQSSEPLRFGL
jgi:hypothetical protein